MTLAAQKKFELLVVFNIFATIYIFIHKTFVPSVVFLLHDSASSVHFYDFGFWWVYHAILWGLMTREKNRAADKILLITSVGMVLLTIFLVLELVYGNLLVKLDWKAISDTLSYGSSFFISAFIWSYYRAVKQEKHV